MAKVPDYHLSIVTRDESLDDRGMPKLVRLATGAPFLGNVIVVFSVPSEPDTQCSVELTATDGGQVVVTSIDVRLVPQRGSSRTGDEGVSLAALRTIPFAAIVDDAIGKLAVAALLIPHPTTEDFPHALGLGVDSGVEFRIVREAAVASRRGRPVKAETLERVAEIVKANPYNPRVVIRRELNVSERTASRWIAKAKEQGLIEEGDQA